MGNPIVDSVSFQLKDRGAPPWGSVAAGLSGGDAALGWSATSLDNGGVITISTDGTYSFGIKPNSPKPLFYWDAETGQAPDDNLGRKNAWDSTFNGAESSAVVTPNRTKSFTLDHKVSTTDALAMISFSSDQLYICRQKYDDFDIALGGQNFNYKPLRFWAGIGVYANNMHLNAQGSSGLDYRQFAENTGRPSNSYTGANQRPAEWVSEEVIYQSSALNTEDGIFGYLQNGRHFSPDLKWTNIDTANPNKYSQLFMGQVSTPAPEFTAKVYYANLYVDDSWCRVVVSDNPVLTLGTSAASNSFMQPLPPSTWSNSGITVNVIGNVAGKYYHVINSLGVVVATGQFI